jgi:RDD family
MTDSVTADSDTRIRGYFWRRFFAAWVDSIFIGAIVALLGIVLFATTGGKVRLEKTFFSVRSCVAPDNVKITQADLKLPADFRITGVGSCTFRLMGFVHNTQLVVEEVTKPNPGTTYTRWFTYPLDEDGRLQTPVFYIDTLDYILLIGYVMLTEWRFGATLGQEFLKLRVRSLGVTDGKLTFAQAAKRLLIFAWIIPLYVGVLAPDILGFPLQDRLKFFIWFAAISAVIALVITANVIIAIRRGQRPWHDRLANTAVILGRDQNIAPTPFSSA